MGRLKYIRATGTQYIDTGIVPDDRMYIKCRAIVPNTSGTNWLFGARQSAGANMFTFAFSTNGYFSAGWGSESKKFDKAYNTEETIHIYLGQNIDFPPYCSISTEQNRVFADFTNNDEFKCPCSLTLFAGNTNDSVTCGKGTIFSFEIYDLEGNPIKKLVPWKVGVHVGMRDELSGEFFSNMGSGTFEYEELPEENRVSEAKRYILSELFDRVLAGAMAGDRDNRVTFRIKRYLDEPDGFFGEELGLWHVSDRVLTVYELVSVICSLRGDIVEGEGYLEILEAMEYGILSSITVDGDYLDSVWGNVALAFGPIEGVVEQGGLYMMMPYPLPDETRRLIESVDGFLTMTWESE